MPESHPKKLLLTRKSTQKLCDDASIDTIKELERIGKLTPIRLTQKPKSQVFYAAEQVRALANPGRAASTRVRRVRGGGAE